MGPKSWSTRQGLSWISFVVGHREIVEYQEAMAEHQSESNAHLERKATYQLFHTPPNRPPPLLIVSAVLPSSPSPFLYAPIVVVINLVLQSEDFTF
jgi:hypothetical protein